jgi:cbb3-type cytochrome oxidase subunit 3
MGAWIVMGIFFVLVIWCLLAPESTEEQQDFLWRLYK